MNIKAIASRIGMDYDNVIENFCGDTSEVRKKLESFIDDCNFTALESAIEEIKKNTRHLAKRQETWFHHQMDSHFYKVDLENIENTINQIIKDVDGWLK